MKETQIIIHHLGLGDHVMLNGMVRHFVGNNKRVVIVAREAHQNTLDFMYRDINVGLYPHNVIIYPLKEGEDSIHHIMKTLEGEDKKNMLRLATYSIHENVWLHVLKNQQFCGITNWSNGVYMQAGITPHFMRSKFKVVRDGGREDAIFDFYKLKRGEYIFVHDDPSRAQGADHRKIETEEGVTVFNPNDTYKEFPNLFDYIKIIENAKEVHCMNSSYAWLVDLMELGKKETNFLHLRAAHTYYPEKATKSTFNEDLWTYTA